MTDLKDAQVVGEPRHPTEEEAFLRRVAAEAPKNNVDLYNQVLREVLRATLILMGGGVLFLDKSRLPPWALWVAASSLFFAFVASFLGVMPYKQALNLSVIEDTRDAIESARRRKAAALWSAAGFLFFAFLFGILGVIVGATAPPK